MIELQYRLLTQGLGVNHLRLVMGTSMGLFAAARLSPTSLRVTCPLRVLTGSARLTRRRHRRALRVDELKVRSI